MLSTIVTAFINSTYGWAVADQFKKTFDELEYYLGKLDEYLK